MQGRQAPMPPLQPAAACDSQGHVAHAKSKVETPTAAGRAATEEDCPPGTSLGKKRKAGEPAGQGSDLGSKRTASPSSSEEQQCSGRPAMSVGEPAAGQRTAAGVPVPGQQAVQGQCSTDAGSIPVPTAACQNNSAGQHRTGGDAALAATQLYGPAPATPAGLAFDGKVGWLLYLQHSIALPA